MATSPIGPDSAPVTLPGTIPPALPTFIHPDDMPDMYALTGVGTCMLPLIEDGACCVFDKREAPKPGDIVGVIFTREAAVRRSQPGMLKRLIAVSQRGTVVVEQVNPRRSYSLPAEEVLAVHKFIGTAESRGDGTAAFRPLKKEAA